MTALQAGDEKNPPTSDFQPRHTLAERAAVDQAVKAVVPKHSTTTSLEPEPMWVASGEFVQKPMARVFPAGQPLQLRIDSGTPFVEPGWEFKDGAGNVWFADQAWSEGAQWGAVGGGGVQRSISPDNKLWYVPPPDAEMYSTERYGLSAYRFRLPPGNYTLKLHFAETYKDEVGSRVFDVKVNGQPVLTDFDPVKEAGGFRVPVVREFKGIAVTDQPLEISFVGKSSQAPIINGIQILGESPLKKDFAFELGRTWRGKDDPDELADPGKALYRVSCGMMAREGWKLQAGGREWLPDSGRNEPRGYGFIGGGAGTRRAPVRYSGGAATAVYRNERYGMKAYEFDVPHGTYTVRLHFAEGFECVYRPGERVFDVSVQGRPVLKDLDPFVAGGGFARASVFDVSGVKVDEVGVLRVGFTDKVNAAMIQGIEVFEGKPGNASEVKQIVGPAKRVLTRPATDAKLLRLLYMGNSMTFFWAIPETVAAMVNSAQKKFWLEPYRHLIGGFTLPKFFSPEWQPAQAWKTILENGKYDYLVLQDAIGGYAPQPGRQSPQRDVDLWREAMANIRIVADIAEANGTRVVLYMIDDPNGYAPGEESTTELIKLVKEKNMVLIPVGEAINGLVREEATDPHGLDFANDGVHYGIHSAYLSACMHFIALTGRSPENNASAFLVGQEVPIEPAAARRIEAFAWKFSTDYAERHNLELGILPESESVFNSQ